MRAYIKYPGCHMERADIENTLTALQDIVGGYIEVVYFSHDLAAVVNEEGKLLDLAPNFAIRGDILCGPVVFLGIDGEEFTDAPDANRIVDAVLAFNGEEEE